MLVFDSLGMSILTKSYAINQTTQEVELTNDTLPHFGLYLCKFAYEQSRITRQVVSAQ